MGGLGTAAQFMRDGLSQHGFNAEIVGVLESPPTGIRRLVATRPLRRYGTLVRRVERRAVLAAVPSDWELAYSMPGLMPPSEGGARVLYQANHHPREMWRAVRAARAQAGGGRLCISRLDIPLLERELAEADLIRVESAMVADQLVDHGIGPERIVHAYPGVDLQRFRPSA